MDDVLGAIEITVGDVALSPLKVPDISLDVTRPSKACADVTPRGQYLRRRCTGDVGMGRG